MLKKYNIVNSRLEETAAEHASIVLCANPEDAEKKFLINQLQIDEHTLSSALDPEEPSRIEFEPDHVALIFKRPKNYSGKDKLMFKVASMGLFLYRNSLTIVISEDIPLFTGKHFLNILSPQDVFLKLIYNSIYHFLEHLRIINMISDEIEQKVSVSMENKYLFNLFSLEKSLVYYLNAINTNGFVFEKLKNHALKSEIPGLNMDMLDDILIENSQCCRQAEIYSNILASLMDARASIVANNLNILMKTLNIITIAIMVPTLVVSVFSMNVTIPLQGHPQAFWLILSLAVASVAAFIWLWKRKKWW